jgi:LemA protein
VSAIRVDTDWEMTVAYIGAGLGVAFFAWLAFAFNGLVKANTRVDEAWSGVDVQLKRRHDLVPKLIQAVAAYAAHERAVMKAIDGAYEGASTASGRRCRQAAEHELSGAIAEVRALAERYPQLKASEPFQRLQLQLAEVEAEIEYARRIYNSNVELFNARARGFPGVAIRRLGGFRPIGYFELNPVWRSGDGRSAASRREAAAA